MLTYNAPLQVTFLGVTKGLRHFYARQKKEGGYQLIQDLPLYEGMEKGKL